MTTVEKSPGNSLVHCVLMILLLVIPAERPVVGSLPASIAGWELTFADEFGGSGLDPSKWNIRFQDRGCFTNFGGNTPTAYTGANIELAGGTLRLTARRESHQADSECNHDADFTSGVISSFDKFFQEHGYFEMRAKIAAGYGLNSAFWLLVNGQGWPWPPEIDVVEVLGKNPQGAYFTQHWQGACANNHCQNGTTYTGPDLSADFHTYGLEWTPDELIWYLDGAELYRYPNRIPSGQPMYLILDLSLGGSFAGDPGGTTPLPATLEVDYVHVYTPAQSEPTFADVPFDHPYHDDIETLYQAGYTAGCGLDPLKFCPEATMNRAESSVFAERGIHAATYDPSAPTTQVFADVPLDSWAAKWVNGLWVDQYTAGCGTDPIIYCPWQGHSRAEGCVFYLRMLYGASHEPAQPRQQTFADVPLDTWYAKWVQAAYDASLIEPCETSSELRFCPNDSLSRAIAAHMMVQAKRIP